MGQWEEMQLGDFLELKRGYDLPKKNREAGNVPLVSSSGVSDTHSESKVKGPGVVTGRYGTIGQVFYIEEDFWPLNTTLYVKDFKDNDPLFIYYFLKTIKYLDYSDKAAVPGVNRNHLHKAEIFVPVDPDEQHKIAMKLWNLDQKIELNRQINQTLEQIAQAIFKSWFVDFEPVKAKVIAMEKGGDELAQTLAAQAILSGAITLQQLQDMQPGYRGLEAQLHPLITERFPEQYGLDYWSPETLQTLADLFPDVLVESELGEIPKGWNAGTLDDLCVLNANSWTKKNAPDEVWYVDLANTKNGVIEDIQYYEWDSAPSRARRILNPGDTIVGTVRPGNRSFSLIGEGDKQLTGSTGFAVLTPKKREYLEYIYIVATSNTNIDRLAHLADGGAYPAVRPDVVSNMETVIPDGEVLKMFSEITRSIFSRRESHFSENIILSNCRDTLLPKLLSGEITREIASPELESAV